MQPKTNKKKVLKKSTAQQLKPTQQPQKYWHN